MIKRVPWFRKLKKTDPEPPVRLPIACGPVSNGEGWWPDSERKQLIRKLVLEKAEEVSRREGIDRREFLMSSCGMATSLYMINLVNGCAAGKKGGDMSVGPGNAGTPGSGTGGSGSSGSGTGGGSSTTSMTGTGGGSTGTGGGGGGSSGGGTGGFNVPPAAMTDGGVAELCMGMGGGELIIDMQSHFATPETNPFGAAGLAGFIGQINTTRFPWIVRSAGCTGATCYDRTEYVNQIFMGSETTIGVLSGISYSVGAGGMGVQGFAALSNEDLSTGAAWLEQMFPGRMLTHCMVMPNDRIDVQLAMMDRNSATYNNWKTYPPWSPTAGGGYWLDDPATGVRMIQKGLDLGSPIFCIHKGFPLSSFTPTYCNPKDVGPAANMFPAAYLVIYHSAFENGLGAGQSTEPGTTDVGWGTGKGQWPEGPYDEALEAMGDAQPTAPGTYPLNRGVNSLIKSLRDNNIGPNGTKLDPGTKQVMAGTENSTHVYSECGGVWPNLLTNRPEEAMHYWGKLLKYIGEDRIVWGTDCLWFGSPDPVIKAFRAFEISQEFQDMYGYPALTPLRKAKILGLNARTVQLARPDVSLPGTCHSDYLSAAQIQMKKDYDEEFGPRRDMMVEVWGPRTRREFLALRNHEHQEKVMASGRIPSYPVRRSRG